MLIGQGLVMGSDVQLRGLDTIEILSVELQSPSDDYLNKMYQNSKLNTKVLLDLYWAEQCQEKITALDTFAENKMKSDMYYHFISLYLESKTESQSSYREALVSQHSKNCDTAYVSLAQ